MFNIAIDGPSAAGKTTMARLLADKYNMKYLDTGSMYRALAYAATVEHLDTTDEMSVVDLLNRITIGFTSDGNIILDSKVLGSEIRNDEISMLASTISKFAKVREMLVAKQQEISKQGGYILDGRDVGSVILPDAQIKLYLDAKPEIRSKRRFDEYISKNKEVEYKELHNEMVKRDTQDMNREHSPLICVDDAYYLDTSDLDIDGVLNEISSYIIDKGVE